MTPFLYPAEDPAEDHVAYDALRVAETGSMKRSA